MSLTITINNYYFCPPEKPHPKAQRGRFAGAYHTDPETGEWIVAAQQVPASTAMTAPLVFTDQNGASVQGPVGVITSSDPNVQASLSADGQSANVTTPASGSVTLTWTDPAGKLAPFSIDLTDQVVVQQISGQFGTFVPGTTA